ncbi:hypothetical protein MC7420_4494 [Coleofasciculus chthonoplastes PCC 7420]|uniref:Uncharacterized protein n=1 Tax=Coleofasciculus chthonoplastes PCC 7420 TaxID=118168 RepID=B4VY80_9CYAN|nr:hypothetical protein MC7420_4494 [Coleofasciculus chthonoplastes PCC 7420]
MHPYRLGQIGLVGNKCRSQFKVTLAPALPIGSNRISWKQDAAPDYQSF